jgi:hypothetical protein
MTAGQMVEVKAYGGVILQRIVIKAVMDTVIVCNPDEWETAKREGRMPEGIGFPVSSIIRID